MPRIFLKNVNHDRYGLGHIVLRLQAGAGEELTPGHIAAFREAMGDIGNRQHSITYSRADSKPARAVEVLENHAGGKHGNTVAQKMREAASRLEAMLRAGGTSVERTDRIPDFEKK